MSHIRLLVSGKIERSLKNHVAFGKKRVSENPSHHRTLLTGISYDPEDRLAGRSRRGMKEDDTGRTGLRSTLHELESGESAGS